MTISTITDDEAGKLADISVGCLALDATVDGGARELGS